MTILGKSNEKGQLIAVRKISGSKRSGSSFLAISFLKKKLDICPDDTIYLTEIHDGEFCLSKEWISEKSISKRVLRGTGSAIKIYTPELPLGTYISVFETKENYLLVQADSREAAFSRKGVRSFQSGLIVSTGDAVYIQRKEQSFFREQKGPYKVTVYLQGHLYMEVEKLENEENIGSLADLVKEIKKNGKLPRKVSYILPKFSKTNTIFLPQFFRNEIRMKKQEHLAVFVRGEKLLIIPENKIDDVTGEKINTYTNKTKKILISQKEHQMVTAFQNTMSELNLNFEGLLRSLKSINNTTSNQLI